MSEQAKGSVMGGRRFLENQQTTPPLVSIVSVVFRARHELPPLLESIFAWQGTPPEIIVIDGGSNDGTRELLQEWNEKIDYWVSEPDQGIYDAMNKGVAAATGKYILHLNAGDRLLQIPSQELKSCLAENMDAACFAVEMQGFGIHRPRPGFIMRFANSWHHQGMFYLRAGHMGYNTQYRIFGDFDLNQRMLKANKSIRFFPDLVVAQQVDVGVSANQQTYNEQYALVRKNFGLPYVGLAILWRYVSPLIPKMKQLIGRK